MGTVRQLLRWAVAPTDRRAKAAALLAAVPLGIVVAALLAVAGAGTAWALAGGLGATAAALASAAWLLAPRHGDAVAGRIGRVAAAGRRLELDVRPSAPRRANIVVPIVDLAHFFGGHIGVFNLARRLAERGVRVRFVTVDPQPPLPPGWQRQIERFEGLGGLFERVEVAFAADGEPLEVSPDDAFIAASTWTAHVAHHAGAALGRPRTVQLIQDYDALTFPNGSLAAVARAAYRLPHVALFSTDPLREYFRRHEIGVFAHGAEAGERDSAVFRSAITPVGPVSEEELARRPRRALLFYARPEEHAARNMFELGVVALSEALAAGAFAGDWRFAGVGATKPLPPLDLPGGRRLELLPRSAQREYAALLGGFSVGLSLMDTPHPSLPPIEMAAAGMSVVTTTFENKDAATLAAISPNIVPAEPSVEGVARALAQAAARVDDLPGRARGSRIDWPTTWDEAFDDAVVDRVVGWLDGG